MSRGKSIQIPLFNGVIDRISEGRPPIVDSRPDVLVSKTYRLSMPYDTDVLEIFLTVSDQDGRAFEFFLNCANVEVSEYLAAVSLLGSRMLRNGFAIETVAEELVAIASPHTGHMRKTGYCASLSALIGQTLLEHAQNTQAEIPSDEQLPDSTTG